MKTSETTKAVFGALAKAQGALEAAVKDSTNPAFRSKYADLTSHVEAIRPVANRAVACSWRRRRRRSSARRATTWS